MPNYVVYTHSINGKVVYIGAGREERAYDKANRSKEHLRVIDLVAVDLIYIGLEKPEAHLIENKLIHNGFAEGLELYNQNPNDRVEHSKILGTFSGKYQAENGIGIHTYEMRSRAGKKGGKVAGEITLRNKTGVHAQTKEQLVRLGKTTLLQRWKCSECGMITSAPNLGLHQKSSGHVGKERTA